VLAPPPPDLLRHVAPPPHWPFPTPPPLKGASHRRPKFFSLCPFFLAWSTPRAPPPPCLLSTLATGIAATPPGNQSRHRRFNPLTVSSQLWPSSHSAIDPSSLPVPPSSYRSTSRPPPTTGAHRSRGNAAAPDRLSASLPCCRLGEHPTASPCPMPSQGPLRAHWLDLVVSRSPPG
jgi:hypothetical protein